MDHWVEVKRRYRLPDHSAGRFIGPSIAGDAAVNDLNRAYGQDRWRKALRKILEELDVQPT